MSKNGYRLFKNYDPYITSPFGYRIHPITGKKTLHAGVDYGTNGKKIPTYGLENGKVIQTGTTSANGNFVYVNYPRLKKSAIYEHLDSIKVRSGEEVNEDTIIGYTGETGDATGVHLHFGWYPEDEQNVGWYQRNWEDFEEYAYPPFLKKIGTPVLKTDMKNQIEVIIDNLYARDNPNGTILGYINKGFYDILAKKVLANYTWYKIASNIWIAYSPDFANLYLKEEKETDTDKENSQKEENNPKKQEEKEDEIKNEEVLDENKDKEMNDEKTLKEEPIIPEDNSSNLPKENLFNSFLKRFIEFVKKILKFLGIL